MFEQGFCQCRDDITGDERFLAMFLGRHIPGPAVQPHSPTRRDLGRISPCQQGTDQTRQHIAGTGSGHTWIAGVVAIDSGTSRGDGPGTLGDHDGTGDPVQIDCKILAAGGLEVEGLSQTVQFTFVRGQDRIGTQLAANRGAGTDATVHRRR